MARRAIPSAPGGGWQSVLLTSDFPPRPGGISNYLAQLYTRMELPDHLVVAPRYAGDAAWDARSGLAVHRARVNFSETWANDGLHNRLADRLLKPAAMAAAMRAAGRRVPGRVLHCGQVMSSGLVGCLLQHRYGDPYVLFLYGGELRKYPRLRATARLFRKVLAGAAGVVTCSEFALREARPFLAPGTPALAVTPGVDCSRFRPRCGGDALRRRLGVGERPLLLTVSRLVATKGHARVIASLPQVLRRHPDVLYLIAGGGPEEAALREQVARMGLEAHVRFAGGVSDAELPSYYDAADLFVLASRDRADGQVEGFGMVLLEAAAAGTPVVATRSGGTVEAVLDGETGILIDQEKGEHLGDFVSGLLADSPLRRRLGGASRDFAEAMSWDRKATALRSWLEQVRTIPLELITKP